MQKCKEIFHSSKKRVSIWPGEIVFHDSVFAFHSEFEETSDTRFEQTRFTKEYANNCGYGGVWFRMLKNEEIELFL